ncbi:MAG: BspA family leucine-rich repeat surface protein, partial [Coriobacteriia bacterium]|nr:BspA family leucine-rich repeat surface protein [Coriobacteriia bacterium]
MMGALAIKGRKTATWKRALSLAIALVVICEVLGSAPPQTAQASGPVGDVISNYPYNPATNATTIDELAYNKVDHNDASVLQADGRPLQGYEQAYTQAESAKWNGGVATPDHVVLSGSKISFYGYGIMPYMDYVFAPAEAATSSGSSFTLIPDNMNFHSFSETGYLFNGEMTQQGANTYYTGYALILSCANDAGMQERDPNAQNTASLRLYYINNERWDTENFTPGTVATTRTLIATIKTGIHNLDPTPFRVSTEIDPTTRAVKVYVDGTLVATVTNPIGGANGPQGFGYYTGYYAHDCNILTRISYEDATINVEAIPPTPTTSTVNFVEQGTGTVLRIPETEDGVAGQKYKITQPLTVIGKDDGITYYLVGNDYSGPNRSDITRRYAADPASNVTTLYYSAATDLKSQPPRKDARVNGGDWDAGAPDAPVSVAAGDTIDYTVTAYAPSTPTAMIMQGSSGAATTTDWLNQTGTSTVRPTGSTLSGPLQKGQISSASFVDLPDDLTYSAADPASAVKQFLANRSDWAGQAILEAWDATETNTTINPNVATSRVIAWITADGSGGYNLYIGGQAGVLMSASTALSFLFNNFSRMSTCNLDQFNTASARNMYDMFYGCSNLTSLDLSSFNTSAVTNMSMMFSGCSSLTSLDLSSFNTAAVTDMSLMFFNCPNLTSLDVSNFNTSAVTTMVSMFYNCSSLTSLDVSSFNTSAVTSMINMFFGCSGLTSLDVRNFNTSAVTNMSGMFNNCNRLTSLDVSSFNTSAVKDMSNMFYGCSSLTSLDVRSFNTSAVTTMASMFYGCSSLTSLDVRSFNTSAVTTMSYMFSYCSGLTSLDLRSFNTSSVTNMSYMFYRCPSLTSLDVSSFNTSVVTSMSWMFGYCSSLTSLDVSSFNTSAVKDMSVMFFQCSSLTNLNLSNFNTSAVTNMANMFYGCSSLTSLDVSSFNTSAVTNISYMFRDCSNLTSLDLSNFNTSAVTNMSYMFFGCKNLNSLAINHFDVSKVNMFDAMFASCTQLTSLDLSYWSLGAVATATTTTMFQGCNQLTDLYLESAPLDQLTTTQPAWFSNNTVTVHVGSVVARDWVAAQSTQPGGGIVIDSVPDPALRPQPTNWQDSYKPAGSAWMDSYDPADPDAWRDFLTDWQDSYKPPAASGSGGGGWTTISDDIPEGLSIKSVSGTESADSLDDAITWQVSGQSVTWSVPNSMLPATVTVTVTVDTGLEDGKTFDNIAYVGSDPTNLTYH